MKVSVLIPCLNEEIFIRQCIQSCLDQTRKPDEIIVVNDGSTDASLSILKSFKDKITIIDIPYRSGNKSFAQEKGLSRVTGDIIITTDGDSILDPNFISSILEEFADPKVVASAGYVKSMKHNWLTSCRQIDYLLSQDVHKKAQGIMNALYVMPGCAAAYRLDTFKKYISFDHDTVTEDLDFTYQYHENKLKVTFCKEAIVYTQDPSTLRDYVTQLRRWHAGNWQNLIKHTKVLRNPWNAFELSLIYLEGMVFPLLLIVALLLNIKLFLFFSITYLTVILFFALYGAKRDKRWDLLLHIPTYFFISFINYAVFIEQLVYEGMFSKKNLTWLQSQRKAVAA